MDKGKKYNILVQYEDESCQWIKNSTSEEALALEGVRRIKSYCNTNFEVCTKRWITGRTQFQKIIVG